MQGRHRVRWTDAERDRLFDAHPPNGTRPSAGDYETIARELGRTVDAVGWMWDDADTAIRGLASTAPNVLREYLRKRGWLRND
jgi:hypothetical protein